MLNLFLLGWFAFGLNKPVNKIWYTIDTVKTENVLEYKKGDKLPNIGIVKYDSITYRHKYIKPDTIINGIEMWYCKGIYSIGDTLCGFIRNSDNTYRIDDMLFYLNDFKTEGKFELTSEKCIEVIKVKKNIVEVNYNKWHVDTSTEIIEKPIWSYDKWGWEQCTYEYVRTDTNIIDKSFLDSTRLITVEYGKPDTSFVWKVRRDTSRDKSKDSLNKWNKIMSNKKQIYIQRADSSIY